MNIRKISALILTLCLLLTAVPLIAQADYKAMKSSEPLIQFIKQCEGFESKKYWDFGHYSIGYGSTCGESEYPNGITEAEADALLRRFLGQAEDEVNRFCRVNGVQPKQSQFDCMVSLTYCLGGCWMDSGYDLPKLIIRACKGQCSELELLNTLGNWINVGGEPWEGTMNRRMRDNYMFFYGKYTRSDYIENDVPYGAIWLDANGGQAAYPRLYTFRGQPYSAFKPLPTPTRSGYRFAGWYDEAGNRIYDSTICTRSLVKAKARWEQGTVLPPRVPDLFTDVYKSDWFFSDVKTATDEGIFAGYSDGSFRPNAQMSRAMFAQVLYRLEGEPWGEGDIPFMDVAPNAWYYDAVCWAYASGIVNGVTELEFQPNAPITREQMATMLYNYSDLRGAADSSLFGSLDSFTDAAVVSDYAHDPMQWAVGTNLIKGTGGQQLSPKAVATRAQAATILVRLSSLVRKGVA